MLDAWLFLVTEDWKACIDFMKNTQQILSPLIILKKNLSKDECPYLVASQPRVKYGVVTQAQGPLLLGKKITCTEFKNVSFIKWYAKKAISLSKNMSFNGILT